MLEGKQAYLNLPFFVVRAVLFFGVWGGLDLVLLAQVAAAG